MPRYGLGDAMLNWRNQREQDEHAGDDDDQPAEVADRVVVQRGSGVLRGHVKPPIDHLLDTAPIAGWRTNWHVPGRQVSASRALAGTTPWVVCVGIGAPASIAVLVAIHPGNCDKLSFSIVVEALPGGWVDSAATDESTNCGGGISYESEGV